MICISRTQDWLDAVLWLRMCSLGSDTHRSCTQIGSCPETDRLAAVAGFGRAKEASKGFS